MIHPMPTQVLLTTTFGPLVRQLSGSLARGVRLIDQFLQDDLTPQKMMTFEGELSALLREVGRRIMAWALNRLSQKRTRRRRLGSNLKVDSIGVAVAIPTRWRRSLGRWSCAAASMNRSEARGAPSIL
jgi:hypothetical protein